MRAPDTDSKAASLCGRFSRFLETAAQALTPLLVRLKMGTMDNQESAVSDTRKSTQVKTMKGEE